MRTRLRLLDTRHRDDGGFALVSVIGLMLVCGILVALMVAGASASITSTSETRAKVQSRAAAESGIDAARAAIISGDSSCVGGTVEGEVADGSRYVAKLYPSSTGIPSSNGVSSCPTTSDKAVLIVSTGVAEWSGVGSARGDESIVEALLSEITPPPAFNQAVFVGDGGTNLNSGWNLEGDVVPAEGEGALLTTGDFTCTNTGTGSALSVIASGDANLSSSCSLIGDLFIQGDLQQCQGSTIDGNVYVQGGSPGYMNCTITGDLVVGGDIAGIAGTVGGSVVSTRGTLTGYSPGHINGGLTVASPIPTISNLVGSIGGTTCQTTAWGPPVVNTCGALVVVAAGQPDPPAPGGGFDQTMPTLTADALIQTAGGGFSVRWSSFARDTYLANGTTQWAESRFTSASSTCSVTTYPTPTEQSAGDSLNGPLTIPTGSTVLDARSDCASLEIRDAYIVVNGDLTLLVNNFKFTNNVTFVRGPLAPTGSTPKVRIVVPRENETDTCSAPRVDYLIESGGGNVIVPSDISMLVYSAGEVRFNNVASFFGQLYTCRMPVANNNISVRYRPVEDSVTDPFDPERLSVRYIRDVS